jgi:UPF0271 protein
VALKLEPFGDAALRFVLPHGVDRRRLREALRSVTGVIDAVVAERHAVVTFEPGRAPADLPDAVVRAASTEPAPDVRREHLLRVVYDGPDLAEVGARAGISPEQVAELHAAGTYEVTAVGFLPGFAYLRGLDPRLVVPRRAVPRPRVPPHSVAIAGPYTGVYPLASPGGWQLVGRAIAFAAFDPVAGAALAQGDTVRFVPERR